MTGKEAKETLKRRYKYQNEWNKQNYDRVSLSLPKGTKDRIKATGNTLNGFIVSATLQALERIENGSAGQDQQ